MKNFNLDFRYKDCEDTDTRDEMFVMELKKYQQYYFGSILPENRKMVKEALDIQLSSVVQYLQLIREGETK